jgi:hypothetical protein
VDAFARVVGLLNEAGVRFLLIRMGTGSFVSPSGEVLRAQYHDLLLPPDPESALRAWQACEHAGLELWAAGERLGSPLDLWLAEHVVAGRVLVRAIDRNGLIVDLTLLVEGFEFEALWAERNPLAVDGVEVSAARAEPAPSDTADGPEIRSLLPPARRG